MLMMKNIKLVLCAMMAIITTISCKKNGTPVAPSTISTFVMRDTLRIDPSLATGQFSYIYSRYNGKLYTVESDRLGFKASRKNNDIILYFIDSSVNKLFPSFGITLKNTSFDALAASYNLTDSTITKVTSTQQFSDDSSAIGLDPKVLNGQLVLVYDKGFNTVSGKIVNLKIPIGYYVPEDISVAERSKNGIFLTNGGSNRTVNLAFSFVKTEPN